jgi:hypothetical protein
MTTCTSHPTYFEDNCKLCKKEYIELKGAGYEQASEQTSTKKNIFNQIVSSKKPKKSRRYKEFTEERAKELYAELLLQYLKTSCNESEAAEKARRIIRKQCMLRSIPFWSWV